MFFRDYQLDLDLKLSTYLKRCAEQSDKSISKQQYEYSSMCNILQR